MFALVALLAALHLTAADNGRAFVVAPQQAIVVTLPSNPSTGYSWVLETVRDVKQPLRYVSHRDVASKKSVPGAPGKEIWRFVATAKGSEHVEFAYERTWQPRRVARRFEVTIRVR